jgi:hypothetical protein
VQQIFLLGSVIEQNIQKQLCHPVGLKELSLLKCSGCDEVSAGASIASAWSSHQRTSAAKAIFNPDTIAAVNRCATQKRRGEG